jgi:hypothetical protein
MSGTTILTSTSPASAGDATGDSGWPSGSHPIRPIEGAGFSVVRGAGSKGNFFGDRVDLVVTKQTRENEFRANLTIIGVQCKVRGTCRETPPWLYFFLPKGTKERRCGDLQL